MESNTTHTWHSLTESTFHNFRNFRNLRPLPFWDNQHPTKISNCAKPISTQNCFTARLKHKNLSQSYWQETMVVYWRMLLTPSNLFVQNLWFLLKRVYLKNDAANISPTISKIILPFLVHCNFNFSTRNISFLKFLQFSTLGAVLGAS